MNEHRFVAYYRVSTDRQGRSGLGLDAQREAVRQFLSTRVAQVVTEFVEVESGGRDDRPQLRDALAECRRSRATLLIAKLDRLARSVAFVAGLMDGDIDFVAVDMPHASRFVVHIMAAVAEHERQLISERTKVALAAAKARGVRLGRNGANLAVKRKSEAVNFANQISSLINEAQIKGYTTTRSIADYLNAIGVRSRQGAIWHPESISRVLRRLSSNQPLVSTSSASGTISL